MDAAGTRARREDELTALDLELPSIDGPPVTLGALLKDRERLVLVFAHSDCPTSTLALRRLARLGATDDIVCIAEETPEEAARLARRTGIAFPVLAEPAPFELSRALEIRTVPMVVVVERDGSAGSSVVGWDAGAYERLLSTSLGGEAPRQKPGCGARWTYDAVEGGLDELEDMLERGWSDGLPVVPPTPERVEAMLAGRDGSSSLGAVPPSHGEATLERVAACAVLAGCRPLHFPLVFAAVEAALDPAFNIGGQAVTPQPAGQLVVVGGPVAEAIGVHSGMGVLGPGWRANLTIGRALRLVVTLTGGGMPGRLDRSTLGHPGKLGFCIAEDEASSPWEPLHVERGFSRDDSVVTVVGCDAPLS